MNTDRFKFRYWDNGTERFYGESDFKLLNLQDDDGLGVFEQCTGIKDKNGKLIYEGDIVKTVTGKNGIVTWLDWRAAFVVKFIELGFPCDICETQEIIGNIHMGRNKKCTTKN